MARNIKEYYPPIELEVESVADANPQKVDVASDIVDGFGNEVLALGSGGGEAIPNSDHDDSQYSVDGQYLIVANMSLADKVNVGDTVVFSLDGVEQEHVVHDVDTVSGEVTFDLVNAAAANSLRSDIINATSVIVSVKADDSIFYGNVVGNLEGDVTGDLTGDTNGHHTGTVSGNVSGDITSTGPSSFSGSVNFSGATISGIDFSSLSGELNNDVVGDDDTVIIDVTNNNISGNTVSATQFIGPLQGNVTGNVTGNATSATTAQTANKVANSLTFTGGATGSFDGSAATSVAIPNPASWALEGNSDLIPQTKLNLDIQLGDFHTYTTTSNRNAASDVIWHQGDRALVGNATDGYDIYIYIGTNQSAAGTTVDSDWANAQGTLNPATDSTLGGIRTGFSAVTATRRAVDLDANNQAFVDIPAASVNTNRTLTVGSTNITGFAPAVFTGTSGEVDVTASGNVITFGLPATISANLSGNVTGNVTGSSGSTTGNAASATKLQNSRNIGGVAFDGTANIDLPGVNIAGTQNTSGKAANADQADKIKSNGDNTNYLTVQYITAAAYAALATKDPNTLYLTY